ERQRNRRRRHLHDLDAVRRAHLLRRHREQTVAGTHGMEIEHRDDVSAVHADVDGRRRLAHDLESLRKLLELQRRAQSAFHHLFAGHGHPQHHADRERQQLEPEVAERPQHLHVSCGLVSCGAAGARRWRISDRRRARSVSASKPRSIWPSTTTEMMPVSSDTTIATASFSSVSPIAARWREPSSLLRRGLIVSGRKHAAAATRSFWTITAPSCSGDLSWKIESSRSYVSTASSAMPPSM